MVRLTRRMLGRASVLILALVLALGTTAPAFAQDGEGLERQGFSGIVTAVNLEAGTMTVETEDGESLIVALTEDTQVRLPSGDVQSVPDVELEVGDRLAILAEVEADGSLTALWTLVKPERPQVEHLLGTVIAIEGNLITIVDAQGSEHTVEMPEQALQGLQLGDMTTLVVNQPDDVDDDDSDEPENPVAGAAVTARQIQERVAEHASCLRQRAQDGEVPVADADERILFLGELMDAIQAHVHGVLTKVLEKVPPQAKGAIERAMERAKTGFEMAKAAIQRAGPPEGVGPPEGIGPSSEKPGPPEGIGPPEKPGPPSGTPGPGNAGPPGR